MNFARNAATVLLTSAVSIPLALLNSVVLTRWLSQDDRGVWALVMNISGMTVTVCALGWSAASVYRIRRAGSAPAEVLGAGVMAMSAASAIVLLGAVLFFDAFREQFMPGVPLAVVAITFAFVPIQLIGRVVNGVARAIDRFDVRNWGLIATSSGGTLVVFLALVVFDAGVIGALSALVCWSLLVLAVRFIVIAKDTGLKLRVRWDELRDGARFGLKSWVQSLAGQVHERIDVLMLAWLLGEAGKAQIAIYAVAVGVAGFLKLVPEAISQALFPKLAGIPDDEMADYAAMVCRHVTLWVVLSTVGLLVVGPWLIPLLYGARYTPSTWPFLVLLPAVGTLTLYRVLSRYFVARDQQQVTIAIQGASVALNVTLNVILIPRMGVLGCAGESVLVRPRVRGHQRGLHAPNPARPG